MIPLLTLPVIVISLVLYLMLSFLGNSFFVWWGALIISILLSFKLLKKDFFHFKTLKFQRSFVVFVLIIFFYIFAKAAVLSPIILTIKQDSFEHIQATDVGDYYKHIFVVTALSQDGIPPDNPYFPPAKLSYYFGYYLIPAAITKIFNIAPNYSVYGVGIFTTLLSLLLFLVIIFEKFKKFHIRLIVFLLVVSGGGIDVITIVLSKLNIFKEAADLALKQRGIAGLQLINIYKAVLFVPQHFFASVITVAATYYLIKEKRNAVFLGISWAFVFLSSTFVFLTLTLWTLIVFIFKKETRILIIKSVLLFSLLSFPYFFRLIDRGNSIYFYLFEPFEFINPVGVLENIFNHLMTFLLGYGPVLMVFPIILFSMGSSFIKNNLMYVFLIFGPIFFTWFIRSPLFNDFSLRTLIPVQIISPLLFMKIYENNKKSFWSGFILVIATITILIGISGFYFEYLTHWKNRSILHPRDSEVILQIRKLPSPMKLAAVDRERWVEFIPSQSFKKVLSPYLFDSYNYIAGDITKDHAAYESLALGLFINENKDKDLDSLIDNQNQNLTKLKDFFGKYPADKLIVNNQIWFKKGTNPWIAIFNKLGVSGQPLSASFTFFDYVDLNKKLAENRILINTKKSLKVQRKKEVFPLSKGIWYITSCKSMRGSQLKLELEDYYLLFNTETDGVNINCTGRLFFLENDENIRVGVSSTVDEITAFPVEIIRK